MKILFINSVCTRNGSTLMLLYFLEWMKKEHPEHQIDVISVYGGSVSNDFDKVATKHYKLFEKKNIFIRCFRLIFRKLKVIKLVHRLLYDYEIKRLKKKNYDLIYNNTIFNIELSKLIKNECNVPFLVVHVHELQNFILSVYPNFEKLLPGIDLFICASGAVKKNLLINWGIQNLEIVYEFSKLNLNNRRNNTANDKIIISGSGRGSKRKGLDYFVEICSIILNKSKNYDFKFQWLGYLDDEELSFHRNLVFSLGLQDVFFFLEEKNDLKDFFSETDIFIMSSREDPFPLVCIEAGSYGIPIFLFDGATGTQEVINDLDYLIAPQFDTHILAEKIIQLLNNTDLLIKTRKLMFERFSEFTVENQSQKLYNVLLKAT